MGSPRAGRRETAGRYGADEITPNRITVCVASTTNISAAKSVSGARDAQGDLRRYYHDSGVDPRIPGRVATSLTGARWRL